MANKKRKGVSRREGEVPSVTFKLGAEYPELLIIERIPREIDRILLVSDSGVKSYGLHIELEGYEGVNL